ncbi:MAG: hypothetical protein LQ347_005292 [Umbilicaria vellea]|nr:MAG: hypothetical protein LQ347_005292 [Umbilicaria vellea]
MVLPKIGGGKMRPGTARPTLGGKGIKTGAGGRGLGKGGARRHRKIIKDTIRGITKGDIRRMARRGGVKRISGQIYEDVRSAMKDRMSRIIQDCVFILDNSGRKTISVSDVIFALRRIGTPVYGFDKDTYNPPKRVRR